MRRSNRHLEIRRKLPKLRPPGTVPKPVGLVSPIGEEGMIEFYTILPEHDHLGGGRQATKVSIALQEIDESLERSTWIEER
jgi:hypothetical protein